MSQLEAFDKWRCECGYNTEGFASVLWLAWKASRAAALEEAAEVCGQFDACDPMYISDAIRALKGKS